MIIDAGTTLPTVTIIIPCLNEQRFIDSALRSLIISDYPKDLLEFFVLDGMSTDGTQDVIAAVTNEFPFVKKINNPGGSKPRALNIGISLASGDIVIRADAHAEYSYNYILTLITEMKKFGADNIGPVRENIPRNNSLLAQSFASVLSSPFGVGNANYNIGTTNTSKTDIVFLFCVKRTLFQKIGLFDERLSRGQDREFNLRLKRLGYNGYLTPNARATYFVRSELSQFLKWAIEAGHVPFAISLVTGRSQVSIRNLAPLAFLSSAMLFALCAFFWDFGRLLFIGLISSYCIFAIVSSYAIARKRHNLRLVFSMPFVFLFWHSAYAFGSFKALLGR